MRILIAAFLGLACFVLSQRAVAQSQTPQAPVRTIDVVDLTVDGPSLIDKRVRLERCELGGANASWVFCRDASNRALNVSIDGRSMPPDAYRRALRECAALPSEVPVRCIAAVTGTVYQFVGISLKDTIIEWAVP